MVICGYVKCRPKAWITESTSGRNYLVLFAPVTIKYAYHVSHVIAYIVKQEHGKTHQVVINNASRMPVKPIAAVVEPHR